MSSGHALGAGEWRALVAAEQEAARCRAEVRPADVLAGDWSSEVRAQRAAQLWGPAFRAVPMPLDHWRGAALPDLAEDDLRVGINWSGPRLTGWDFTVADVVDRLAHALAEPPCDG
ncbi:DUF2750 domain-containing protein [Streptomyces sp. NPDC088763]|uniref:DUF2750 domain-containing protein n=1 Tax=Streptomyces sp. NPDC088763 TaxID=3365892 RepID=UPI0038186C46